MKQYLYRIFLVSAACCFWVALKAQNAPQQRLKRDTSAMAKQRLISAVGEWQGDSAVLRWSPADPSVWLAGQNAGYIVKRFTVDTVNKKLGNEVTLTPTPIKPWSVEQFKTLFEQTRDTLLAAAAEIIYNKNTAMAVKDAGPAELMDKANQQNDMRLYGQLIACFSPACAKGMGLSFTDKTTQKGKEYLYQVFVAPNNLVKSGDTCFALVSTYTEAAKLKMPAVRAKALDRTVQFAWDKDVYSSFFVAYLIERSDDGGKTFHPSRKLPVLEMAGTKELRLATKEAMIRDSLPQNYFPYQFRIRGINAFGDRSLASNTVTITGEYRVAPPPAAIISAKNFKNNLVKIDWKLTKPSHALAGYLVGRGEKFEGPFAPLGLDLLPASATSFIDSSASSEDDNYYVITAFDTAGNFSNSAPGHVVMIDTVPPDAPVIAGTIDTAGRVTVTWQKPKARDVVGYIVQRANALNHNFIPVSKGFVTDTVFVDSIPLRTLTKHIFYRVLAYDKVRNASRPSDTADIAKPDIVRPVPAVFVNYVTSDTSIQLFWNPSSSTDLNKQQLYRKTGTGGWLQLALLDKTTASYNDTAVQKLTLYTYLLISEDSAGLKSDSSFPISAKTFFNAASGAGRITAEYMADSLAVKVGWQLPVNASATNIVLYRSVNGGGMVMYQNIPAGKQGYIDRHVTAGNTYGYSFKPIYAANREGGMSNTATVTP